MGSELGQALLEVEEVRREILALLSLLPAETCPLAAAHLRVLREDVGSSEPLPPFDNSAMDGYAVRAEDVAAASAGSPVVLRVQEDVPAGRVARLPLSPGTAVRIMTGAPLPGGADAVVPHELTVPLRGGGEARFSAPARRGAHVRVRGSDLAAGERPLRSGQRLRGPQLALAAALGREALRVTRRPRVALLSPGDELVEPGRPLGAGQVRCANPYGLAGFLLELGVDPLFLGIVPDEREAIRAALRRAAEAGADAVITTGGVSAGDRDFVQALVREEGKPGRVYKVSMRPGKPQAFGILEGIPLFGLPGNPASALVSFAVFVRPALRRMMGEEGAEGRFPVRFREEFRYRPGRTFFLRARVEPDRPPEGSGFHVAEIGEQDSSVLSSLARANALVELPADREAARAGEAFPAEWLHA